MKLTVEIQRISNDPANTMLQAYIPEAQFPICDIWEEDFFEVLTDRQIELLEKGQTRFKVDRDTLLDYSKRWFGQNGLF